MMKGYNRYQDFIDFGKEQGWGVSNRQISSYVKAAYDKMTEIVISRIGKKRDFVLSNLFQLQQEAIRRNELDLVLKIVKEIAKVSGVYEQSQIEVENANRILPHTATDEEIAEMLGLD